MDCPRSFVSILFIVAGAYFCTRNFSSATRSSCKLKLTTSTIAHAGRGIIAGIDLEEDDILEDSVSVTIKYSQFLPTQLSNYCYGTHEEDISTAVFGTAMIYNHHANPCIEHRWADSTLTSAFDQKILQAPYSYSTSIYYHTNRRISQGEELFVSYGDEWFSARGISLHTSESSDAEKTDTACRSGNRTTNYICLSDITILPSTLPNIGKGVFATRSFRRGEVITVSPVLLLDIEVIEESFASSVIANYCISDDNAAVCLLPIGAAAIMNHHFTSPNVAYTWFQWDMMNDDSVSLQDINAFPADNEEKTELWQRMTNVTDKLNQPLPTLLRAPYAPLDIVYYALRDIAEGEELFINYGKDWDSSFQAWKHYEDKHGADTIGAFRHSLIAPDDMFPSHWYFEEVVGVNQDGPYFPMPTNDEEL